MKKTYRFRFVSCPLDEDRIEPRETHEGEDLLEVRIEEVLDRPTLRVLGPGAGDHHHRPARQLGGQGRARAVVKVNPGLDHGVWTINQSINQSSN